VAAATGGLLAEVALQQAFESLAAPRPLPFHQNLRYAWFCVE